MHTVYRPSSAISADVTAPDTRWQRMLRQPAMLAFAGAQPALRVTDAPPSRPGAPRPSCAGALNDLHVYDPAAEAWTDLNCTLSGAPPSPRMGHGFTSAGGKLYVHGGWDGFGDSGEGGARAGQAEGVGMVRAEAGRRDMLPRDRRRDGQAGMGQGGKRDGRRADAGVPCLRAFVGALIGAGMVWGGGDAWRTGGRHFAGVLQRRRLARAQAPRLGGVGRGGERPACFVCGGGQHACICAGADAPRPSIRPFDRV
jgi:hypothetical protein